MGGIMCCASSDSSTSASKSKLSFITPDDLKVEIDANSSITPLCVVDCGANGKDRDAQTDYDTKKIPGAVFMNQSLWIDIVNKKWKVPEKAQFLEIFKSFGRFRDMTHFVCYDHCDGDQAMFGAMILQMYGCTNVSVLNGKASTFPRDAAPENTASQATKAEESKSQNATKNASAGVSAKNIVDVTDQTAKSLANHMDVLLATKKTNEYLIFDCRPRMQFNKAATAKIPNAINMPFSEFFQFHICKDKEKVVNSDVIKKIADDLANKKVIVYGPAYYHMVKLVLEHHGLTGCDDRGVLYYPSSAEEWLEKQEKSKASLAANQASTQMEFEKNEVNQQSPKRQQLSSQDATDEIPRDSHAGDNGLSGPEEELSDDKDQVKK